MPLLEHLSEKLLDGFATGNRSLRSHLNGVLLVQRGHGSGIAVIECLVKLLNFLTICSSICEAMESFVGRTLAQQGLLPALQG
jgi:hypothetical protein